MVLGLIEPLYLFNMGYKFNPLLPAGFDIAGSSGTGDVVGTPPSTDNAIARYDGITGKIIQNSGVTISDTGEIDGATTFNFDILYTPTGTEPIGTMFWNEVDGTIDMRLKNGATLQTGQELHFYGKASGNILNGELCQFAGAEGDHILIKKVVAAEIISFPHYLVGVATQNITNGTFGYVTWFGKVNGVYTKTPLNNDTVDWNAGDVLYFSNSTGQLTKTQPSAPERQIIVAAVVKAQTGSSETGILLIRPTFGSKLTDLDDVDGIVPSITGQILSYDAINNYWEVSNDLIDHVNDLTNPHETSDANLIVSDITTNNVTTLKHGFVPKLPGSATQFFNGAGNYVTISGTGTPSGYTATTFSGQTSINIVHNFGVQPLVQVLISSAVVVPYSIVHNTDNDFTVTFSTSQSGTIIASAGLPIPNVTTTATNYTVTTNDNIVQVTAKNVTITLPTAAGVTGKLYSIDNTSTGNIFVTGTSGQTVQGMATNIIPANSCVVFYSTGSVWRAT